MSHRTGARGLVAGLAALLVVFLGLGSAATAYQVPTAVFSQGTDTATGTMPGSGLTQTITTSGQTTTMAASTAGSRGLDAGTYSPALATGTPSEDIRVDTETCASTGPCPGLGTVTIAFSQPVTNPVLHIAGIGGVATELSGGTATRQSELHSIFTLATAGVTLTKVSTGNNVQVSGGTITAVNDDTSVACTSTSNGANSLPSKATAACGSVRVNGTVTSVAFNVTAVFTKNSAVPAFNSASSGDAVSFVASAGQDFGDAPASYDGGNAARAVLTDLKLGPAVTEDNASVANGTSSPNAGAGADGDGNDDGVTLTPLLTTATSYSTTVTISGASKAGQVCGWIDFNKNGSFQPSERACAAVASGQTAATLTWPGLSGLSAGSVYARFRVGYTTSQVQSPTGAADSGEVEDYPFTIVVPAPPAASPDTAGTPQDVNVTVNPVSNDTAGAGAVLVPSSVVLRDPADGTFKKTVTIPGEGTYTVQADGSVVFDPLPAFTGTATPVTYRIADNTGQTATSTITIIVTPVTPDANNDTNTTPYDTPVTTPVLSNDTPGHPSAPLVPGSVCIVTGATCVKTHTVPGEGSYTVNPDATIAFDPAPGFSGKTTPITYRVADDNGSTDTATLTITVQAPPAPTAQPDTGTTPQNVNITVNPLSNDSAATGIALDPASVVLRDPADGTFKKTVPVPGEGTYTVHANGTVTFDPVPSFTGTATSLGYRVSDSSGQTAESTITITVTPVTPQAVSDSRTTPFETPVTIPVLDNDTAGSPDAPLVPGSVCLVSGTSCAKTLTVPGEGTYTVNPDGTVKFTPADGYTGTTTSLTYQVADSNGTTARATITVTVQKPPPPAAQADTGTTKQDVDVTVNPLTNDSAGTGVALDPASVVLLDPADGTYKKTVTIPGEGVYTVQVDGQVTFDPVPSFSGGATPVGYRVADTLGQTATSTITITVTPITPEAVDDTGSTPYDTPVTTAVLGNDHPGDPSAPLVPSSVQLRDPADGTYKDTVTIPGQGTYMVNPDGSVAFDPVPGFSGEATPLTYKVADDNGTTDTATLTITVGAPPKAEPDTGITKQDVNLTVSPLGNDTPGTGATLDPASVVLRDPADGSYKKTVTIPGEGTYTVQPDGTVVFDPLPAFTGTATPVTYRVADSNGSTATSTIGITVTPITPTAVDDAATTPYKTPVTVPVLGNDSAGDPSAPLDPSSVQLRDPADGTYKKTVTIPGEGTYTVQPNGSVTFDPADGFHGVTTPLTYRVEDDNGTPTDARLTVTVGDAPEANPDTATTKQNVDVTVDPLSNDKPGTGGTLDPASVQVFDPGTQTWGKTATIPGEGTYTVDPQTGQITFDPEPGFTGKSSVPYRVTDSHGNAAASTVTITVDPITPTAEDDTAITPHNTPVTVPVAANDKSGDPSAPLVPSSVMLIDPGTGQPVGTLTVPGEGMYTVQPDGSVRFVPVGGFTGTTTPVTYQIKDSNGTPATAKLTITVGDRPVANPDTGKTKQDVPVTIDPLANDKPGSGGSLDPTTVRLIDPKTGDPVTTVTVPGEGTWTVKDGKLVFDPLPGFTGTTTPVRYEVKDTNGNPARSTATVTVTPVTPDAVDDARSTPYRTPVTAPVLGNDKAGDPSAPLNPASVVLRDPADGTYKKSVTIPGEGVYTVRPDGTVRFVPARDFTGKTTPLTYRVADGNGTTTAARLVITVGKPSGAKADPDRGSGRPGKPVVLNPPANDTPSKGATWQPGTVCLVTGSGDCVKKVVVPGVGTWTVGKDGTVRFVSVPDFTGTARIPYRVTDTNGVTVQSTATVTIAGKPAPPKPHDDDDELPNTGGPSWPLPALGAALLAVGLLLLGVARRRRT